MSNPTDNGGPVLSASDRMAREPLDRLLGRLAVEHRLKLAVDWADRAVRVHAPVVLAATGFAEHAKALKALPATVGEDGAKALRDASQKVFQAVDAVRVKEEAAHPERDDANSPSARASRVMSFATEAAKAVLGEAGLKVRAVTGAVVNPAVKKEPVDVGVQRAVLAAKHAMNTAKVQDEAAGTAEELLQKQEAVAILKAPRKI